MVRVNHMSKYESSWKIQQVGLICSRETVWLTLFEVSSYSLFSFLASSKGTPEVHSFSTRRLIALHNMRWCRLSPSQSLPKMGADFSARSHIIVVHLELISFFLAWGSFIPSVLRFLHGSLVQCTGVGWLLRGAHPKWVPFFSACPHIIVVGLELTFFCFLFHAHFNFLFKFVSVNHRSPGRIADNTTLTWTFACCYGLDFGVTFRSPSHLFVPYCSYSLSLSPLSSCLNLSLYLSISLSLSP